MQEKVPDTVCFVNFNEGEKVSNPKCATRIPGKDKYKIRRTHAIECEHGKPRHLANLYLDLDDDPGHRPIPDSDNDEKY
jgi:hypothetical protein